MRIAIYANQDRFPQAGGDTSYIHDALEESFEVTLLWEPDPELCSPADVVFVRFPRARPGPVHFLRGLRRQREKLFINPPDSLLRFGSKRHLVLFPHLTVPTIITRSRPAILAFAREHGVIVLKPLNGYSGRGIVRFDCSTMGDTDLWAAVHQHIGSYGTPVVQAFVDRVREWGDKRINVVAYEPISAVRTLPAEGSFICHRAAGGREVAAELTGRDLEILEDVVPFLRENRIWWAGVDIVGPHLGEINISSPMMIRRADEAHGTAVGRDAVIRHLRQHADHHGL